MSDNIINISLNNDKIYKQIKIDSKRKKYVNKALDITIMEIKKEDNINTFLSLDDLLLNDDINNYNDIYKNESLYILNYIYGKDVYVSYGILNNIKENKIIHKCNTDTGSSGSPIMLLKNNKVIGVHYDGSRYDFYFGTLLKKSLLEYIKINEEENNNHIIAEIDIKEKDVDKNIRIINSFEEVKRTDDDIFDTVKKRLSLI